MNEKESDTAIFRLMLILENKLATVLFRMHEQFHVESSDSLTVNLIQALLMQAIT